MIMTSENVRLLNPAGSAAIEQLYVTHCLHGEGVSRKAGFGVRASSTDDLLLLRYALEYPPYEIPEGAYEDKPTALAAPRRLAFVRIPGGKRALIHSVYLPESQHGRDNNFFSHILVAPTLAARDALATWGSPEWTTERPEAIDRDLPLRDALPLMGAVNDQAVTAFLQPIVSADDQNLATLVCPARLVRDQQQRWQLLHLALQGCMLALQAEPNSPRGRFFISAEPGLTALLLYAAARLLPPPLIADLTFSTYENLSRFLRSHQHARVVGAYSPDSKNGLEDAYYTTRGYALDAFSNRASPEMGGAGQPTISEWIDLAAQGEWKTIDQVYGAVGKSTTSVISFQEGLTRAKVSNRLASNQARPSDLVALKTSSWGPKLLEEHRHKVWSLVRDGSLTDEFLRKEFDDLLRENLPELEQKVVQILSTQPPGNWRPHWKLLASLLKDDPIRLREAFLRILPEPPYEWSLRLALLEELLILRLPANIRRPVVLALLRKCTGEDLQEFAQSALPRKWFAWAIIFALRQPETRVQAVQQLHAGEDELVLAFWDQFKLLNDERQRREILAPLFPSSDPQNGAFLSRMLKIQCTLRPETMDWVLDWLSACEPEWMPFWLQDNHLGLLLNMLQEFREEAGPIWHRFCQQITQGVLLGQDPQQQSLLLELMAARDRLGGNVPRKAAQAVADWLSLREHFEKASPIADEASQLAVRDACNRCVVDPVHVLAHYFQQFVEPHGVKDDVLTDFVGFFHGFYRPCSEYEDFGSRLLGWLQVVEVCSNESQKTAYQLYYFEHFVPREFQWRLAEECRRNSKLTPAAFEQLNSNGPTDVVAKSLPITVEETSTGSRAELKDIVFQLTGVYAADGSAAWLRTSTVRLLWLTCSIGGGLLAGYLSGLSRVPAKQVAAVALFIPVVLVLAEGIALQAVGLAVEAVRSQTFGLRQWLLAFGKQALTGLLLGVVCGLIAAGGAKLLAAPSKLVWALGVAIPIAAAGAAGLGFALPLFQHRWRKAQSLSAGVIARSLSEIFALVAYITLAIRFLS